MLILLGSTHRVAPRIAPRLQRVQARVLLLLRGLVALLRGRWSEQPYFFGGCCLLCGGWLLGELECLLHAGAGLPDATSACTFRRIASFCSLVSAMKFFAKSLKKHVAVILPDSVG